MIADDKYTYPGSGGVLVNNYNIRDAEQLDKAVNAVASVRWMLFQSPRRGRVLVGELGARGLE